MLGAPEMFQCVPHLVVYLSQTLLVTRFVFAYFNIRCIEDNLCYNHCTTVLLLYNLLIYTVNYLCYDSSLEHYLEMFPWYL